MNNYSYTSQPDIRGNIKVLHSVPLIAYNFEVKIPPANPQDKRSLFFSIMQKSKIRENIVELTKREEGIEILDVMFGANRVQVVAEIPREKQYGFIQELTNAINKAIDPDYRFSGLFEERETL